MKKSTFAAMLAFLACAVGALTAFAIYLWKRERELAEYEQLLFEADSQDEDEDEDTPADAEEEYILSVQDENEE